MDGIQRNELIAKYGNGFAEVEAALENFPAHKLTAKPFAGKWSAAEIIQHLADSEMTSAIRLRKLLTEAFPVIYGYNQDNYAERLRYNERDFTPALDAFRGARATSLQLLQNLSNEDWQREGWHNEHGRYTVEKWLEIYADHAHGHAEQIRRLRDALKSES
jgi:hypothetical protein